MRFGGASRQAAVLQRVAEMSGLVTQDLPRAPQRYATTLPVAQACRPGQPAVTAGGDVKTGEWMSRRCGLRVSTCGTFCGTRRARRANAKVAACGDCPGASRRYTDRERQRIDLTSGPIRRSSGRCARARDRLCRKHEVTVGLGEPGTNRDLHRRLPTRL